MHKQEWEKLLVPPRLKKVNKKKNSATKVAFKIVKLNSRLFQFSKKVEVLVKIKSSDQQRPLKTITLVRDWLEALWKLHTTS